MFRAQSPQRRERLLNLASLRKGIVEAEPSERAGSAAPTEEVLEGTHIPEAADSE